MNAIPSAADAPTVTWPLRVGIFGLYIFAFGSSQGAAVGNISLAVILAAFLAMLPTQGGKFWRDPMVKLGALFLAYHFISSYLTYDLIPPPGQPNHDLLVDAYFEALPGWAMLWAFLVAGWFLSFAPRHMLPILTLAAIGLLVDAASEMDWSQLLLALTANEHRLDFGSTVNGIGLVAAVGLYGTVVLGAGWYRPPMRGDALTWAARAGILVVGIAFLCILLASQSRTAWLALLSAAFGAVCWMGARHVRRLRGRPGRLLVDGAVVVGVVTAILIAVLQTGLIQERVRFTLEQESAVLSAVLEGRLDDVPHTSVGDRVYMYRQGVERFLERPLLGWGPGTAVTQHFAEADGYPFLHRFADLHNGFFLIFVRFGLLGALPFLFAGGLLAWRVIRAARMLKGRDQRLAVFALGAMFITAVASVMNFRWIHLDFSFFWILVGGVAYAVSLPERYRPAAPSVMGNTSAGRATEPVRS